MEIKSGGIPSCLVISGCSCCTRTNDSIHCTKCCCAAVCDLGCVVNLMQPEFDDPFIDFFVFVCVKECLITF